MQKHCNEGKELPRPTQKRGKWVKYEKAKIGKDPPLIAKENKTVERRQKARIIDQLEHD